VFCGDCVFDICGSAVFARLSGAEFRPAEVINLAGEDGEEILISDTQWNCTGLGIAQHIGRGYNAQMMGRITNQSDRHILKVNITVVMKGRTDKDAAFVWFDLYHWKPKQSIEFHFPIFYPVYRAVRCEVKINEVLWEEDSEQFEKPMEIFFPHSNQFVSYGFVENDRIIHANAYYRQLVERVEKSSSFSFFKDLILAMILNFLCIFLGAMIVNVYFENLHWKHEFDVNLWCSIFLTFCFIVINMGLVIMSNALAAIPKFYYLLNMFGFFIKMYLFFYFFNRNFWSTLLIIIAYFCLSLSFQGLLKSIFG
jgi:hypothetical protein